jgi:hypothetical protein
MAGQHGGPRPGAGRKTDAEIARCRELIAKAVTDQDWLDIFKALLASSKRGNFRSAELLMRYAFGVPPQAHEVTGEDGGSIVFEIVRRAAD